jgi:radical SAM protein (TIGR01212 family)
MQFSNGKRYNDFSSFVKSKFGERVQKVSLNTGFTCPNRDGTKGVGGCTYCNNNTFSPNYCKADYSIPEQLDEGIRFFSRKNKTQKYLAYFQAYTNTYADIGLVKELYTQAISHPEVVGLVIGTRPDCVNEEIINFLSQIAQHYFVSLEFGVESTLNRTLKSINRCHTYEESIAAFELSKNRGIHLGAHIILGLPGESRIEMLNHGIELSKLPIQSLKIHQLQIVKNTVMAIQYKKEPEQFQLFNVNEYIDFLTSFIASLRPDIIIERFISESPPHLLIAPQWGLKNFEMVEKVNKRLIEKQTWQGKNYKGI